MVITLRAGKPFGRANHVPRVGRVDLNVGFRVVVDQHRGRCREPRFAPLLSDIRSGVLARGCRAIARRFAGVPVDGTVAYGVGNFRRVATNLLCGGKDVRDVVCRETIPERVVGLRSLGDVAYSWPHGGGARRGSVAGRKDHRDGKRKWAAYHGHPSLSSGPRRRSALRPNILYSNSCFSPTSFNVRAP